MRAFDHLHQLYLHLFHFVNKLILLIWYMLIELSFFQHLCNVYLSIVKVENQKSWVFINLF